LPCRSADAFHDGQALGSRPLSPDLIQHLGPRRARSGRVPNDLSQYGCSKAKLHSHRRFSSRALRVKVLGLTDHEGSIGLIGLTTGALLLMLIRNPTSSFVVQSGTEVKFGSKPRNFDSMCS
jgi:hypothetical protein